MNSPTKWIREPRTFEQRDILDFALWIVIIIISAITIFSFLVYPILVVPFVILFLYIFRLLIINYKIGVKLLREQKKLKEGNY